MNENDLTEQNQLLRLAVGELGGLVADLKQSLGVAKQSLAKTGHNRRLVEIGAFVRGRKKDKEPVAWLYGKASNLDYKVCTMWSEQVPDSPIQELFDKAPTFPSNAAPQKSVVQDEEHYIKLPQTLYAVIETTEVEVDGDDGKKKMEPRHRFVSLHNEPISLEGEPVHHRHTEPVNTARDRMKVMRLPIPAAVYAEVCDLFGSPASIESVASSFSGQNDPFSATTTPQTVAIIHWIAWHKHFNPEINNRSLVELATKAFRGLENALYGQENEEEEQSPIVAQQEPVAAVVEAVQSASPNDPMLQQLLDDIGRAGELKYGDEWYFERNGSYGKLAMMLAWGSEGFAGNDWRNKIGEVKDTDLPWSVLAKILEKLN